MLQRIFAHFFIVGCTVFCPKPMLAKVFRLGQGVTQKQAICKTGVLLKPFSNAYLAVSRFGMRHPKPVSHIASFSYPNAMGIRALAISHSGKRNTGFGCRKLSHFRGGRFDNFQKVVKSGYHGQPAALSPQFLPMDYGLSTMDYSPIDYRIFPYIQPLFTTQQPTTMHKRAFIKNMAMAGLSIPLSGAVLAKWVKKVHHQPAEEVAHYEDFWAAVRAGYKLKPDYINLENGYYNFMPEELLENFISQVRMVNLEGSYYMRTVQFDNKKAIAARLAELVGCGADELVITRNTTESLDMVIGGQHWTAGDEAVMAEQDYGSMLEMFKLVAKKYGVVNKIVSVPNQPANDEEIVDLYAKAITPKTRLLMISHMINITGHILPVRKICDMAHSKGVPVMVDGAHAVAHIQFNLADLNCDYYGASLHKWLSTPLGAGMLYVKKENISKIWPLLAEGDRKDDDITRLNHIGTHPVHTDLAINASIDYYEKLGAERKEARMRFLQQHWTSQARKLPNVVVNTPEDPARACGIANVGVQGMKPGVLAETLLKKYNIYTVAIDGANVHGCRITPNVYTTPEELDALVRALKELGAGV